jgi:hypothetical protein
MGHDAEILGVYDPDLGYYAEKCPYKQPQRAIRPTFLAGLLGRVMWTEVHIIKSSASTALRER